MVDVLLPEVKLTLPGLTDATSPGGLADVERVTVPAKPDVLPNVIVEVPEPLVCIDRVLGLEEMVKSPTPTITTVEWNSEPLVALIVTV